MRADSADGQYNIRCYTAIGRQKVVTPYWESKQLLLFGFSRKYARQAHKQQYIQDRTNPQEKEKTSLHLQGIIWVTEQPATQWGQMLRNNLLV